MASRILRDEVLGDLNSLLLIPSTTIDPLLLTHTSIRDFLLDPDRCAEQSLVCSVNIQKSHERLVMSCLQRMNRLLKYNIFELTNASQPFSEVRDVAFARLPTGLVYCCQAWTFHLVGTGHWSPSDREMSHTLAAELVACSTENVLFWLEVMSALGSVSQAVGMAGDMNRWLSVRSIALEVYHHG